MAEPSLAEGPMQGRTPHPRFDPDTALALRLFLAQVSARYAVSGAYLFGSRASGEVGGCAAVMTKYCWR